VPHFLFDDLSSFWFRVPSQIGVKLHVPPTLHTVNVLLDFKLVEEVVCVVAALCFSDSNVFEIRFT
jgi:hypothetical protein